MMTEQTKIPLPEDEGDAARGPTLIERAILRSKPSSRP